MLAKLRLALVVGTIVAGMPVSVRAEPTITQAELVRRTQELFDAVAVGNKAPWQEYFADDCLFFDEKGRSMDKPKLVADITPLPPGYSGTIRLVNPQSRIASSTAILSYDLDETEDVLGQHLTARYHGTDTWLYRAGRWQIAASQVLRYYEDPPAGRSDPAKYPDYVGSYRLGPDRKLEVLADAGKLYQKRDDGPREELIIESGDIFFRQGVEGRSLFRRDAAGHVDALIVRRNNEDIVWTRQK